MTAALAGVARPVTRRIANEAFYRAVVAGGRAPSARNAPPWRWRVRDAVLDLFVDRDLVSRMPGPGGRLATIGCGAALHHARLTLAARGWRVTVTRRPDPADPTHLAALRIDGPAPVSPGTAGLARAIKLRRTDVRPVAGDPVPPETLRTIVAAFEAQHVRIAVLRPDQILGLAVATAEAPNEQPAAVQWHTELASWAGNGRIIGAGDAPRLPVAPGDHDRAATFAVLYGPGDGVLDWLHAGEALSAGSLVAVGFGVSVLPFSAPIEYAGARERLVHAVPELQFPYLMMRLGRHAGGSTPLAGFPGLERPGMVS